MMKEEIKLKGESDDSECNHEAELLTMVRLSEKLT